MKTSILLNINEENKEVKNITGLIKFTVLKHRITYPFNFIKLLIIYLIEKYYYKFSFVYFVIKSSRDVNTFNFFMDLNELKEKLTFTEKPDEPYTRLMYFYLIMFIGLIYYGPLTWFLMYTITEPKNWMLYCFEHINFSNLL